MRLLLLTFTLSAAACDTLQPLRGDFGVLANPTTDTARVELGRALFHEKALSVNQSLSCASCHGLDTFGQDGKARSVGVTGVPLRRNTPSVFNAAGQVAQFWDGRSPDVESQALKPVLNADEMGMPDEAALVTALEAAGYRDRFVSVFPREQVPLSGRTVALALSAFERTLATRAPIDDFLEGRADALTPRQRQGFDRFVAIGCTNCHSGPLAGGGRFERLGDEVPWPDESDLGRFEVTGLVADRHVFKIPSLRNVAKTAPYFHDGSQTTLEDAVRKMGWHQLRLELSDEDVALLVDFLDAFTSPAPQPAGSGQ
ncbi:MAG: cytochrome c peroxidase [Myxococcaceae bacterium]|nr:cytochrome c peroxidase [Myxococcaceae bacterium]